MTANQAGLMFVHRLVTNFYGNGQHDSARKVLEEYGGAKYLEEVEENQAKEDVTKNILANLSFVWWRVSGDTIARERALTIWTAMVGSGGELGLHATHMLGYIALANAATPKAEIRERIAQLRVVRQQPTTDVERADRMADLAQKLGEQFWRCKKE